MAHGLGLSSAHNYYVNVDYPTEISGLALWLKYNTGYTSENDETSEAHNLDDNDRIKKWSDRSGNGNDAQQSTASDMPKYQISDGSLNWLTGSRWFDLKESILIEAEEDFTLIMRINFASTSNDAFFGDSSNDFFMIIDANTFRVKIGGAGQSNFAEATKAIGTAGFYTIMLIRSGGDNLNVFVNGADQKDQDWDAAEGATDNDAFTISNIGSTADDTNELGGYVKDVLIYKGAALDEGQRLLMYSYLDAQLSVS